MEEEKAESYRALYRVRPLIYHIGDIRLWVPIRQDGIILWFVYVFIFFVFCYVIPVLAWLIPLDPLVVMLAGPIAAAYYSAKLDPAGKSVPGFLFDVLKFLLRPKWLIGWREVRFCERKGRLRLEGWCRPYTLQSCADGLEEWIGGRTPFQGRVKRMVYAKLPGGVRVKWKGKRGRLSVIPVETGRLNFRSRAPASWEKSRNQHWTTKDAVEVHVTDSDHWHIRRVPPPVRKSNFLPDSSSGRPRGGETL